MSLGVCGFPSKCVGVAVVIAIVDIVILRELWQAIDAIESYEMPSESTSFCGWVCQNVLARIGYYQL